MKTSLRIGTALAAVLLLSVPGTASAETIAGALARAYRNNHDLGVARAQLRATDENVPQAKAGLRPTVGASGGLRASRARTTSGDRLPTQNNRATAAGFGITVDQVLFDGFQTPNNVRSAEATVKAARSNLSNTEQNILFDTAAAYMNVIRDREIAELRRRNLSFLGEQLRAASARFDVGEGTRTDVAQAQSEQALATALLNSALAQVATSEAEYYRIVGDAPGRLDAARSPKTLPKSVSAAIAVSQKEHPAILASISAVDAAAFQVKSIEGRALPVVALTGSVDDEYALSDTDPNSLPGVDVNTSNSVSASVGVQLTVPLYQGGLVAAQVRQAKEVLGQRRIEVDARRDEVRAAVATAWAEFQAAKANVVGYEAQARTADLALSGVVEERNVGQRTTLDVLNAQADLIAARILQAGARRDEVVAGYAVLSAVGRLSAGSLKLAVATYDPKEHYDAVKDKWSGMRTPDGR